MGIRREAAAIIARAVARIDGWSNALSGLGTSIDAQVATTFLPDYVLSAEEDAQLYVGDPLAGICADAYPEEALRLPVAIQGDGGEAIGKALDAIRFADKLQAGLSFGRAMGCAIAIPGIDDGGKLDTPFRGKPGSGIEFVDVYDRRELAIDCVGVRSNSPHAHEPELFRVSPHNGQAPFVVHRSRCLVFGGVVTPNQERQNNGGWDYSIYDRIYKTLRSTNDGYLALGHMLNEASQSVFKLHGLLGQIMDPGGKARLAQRGLMLDMFRGLTRSILLDASTGESYERHSMTFSGVPDSVDRLINMLSAVTRIPVTVLMGQAPAGLNATGDGDARNWYNRVKSYQTREVAPAYVKVLRMLGAPANCVPEFPSLWEPTEKEQAEIDKAYAETDQIYLINQVVSPEDVARARMGAKRKRLQVDLKALDVKVAPPPPEAVEVAPTAVEAAPPAAVEVQKVALTATTLETILTVNQGLEAYGQPLDPVNGDLKIAELKAKQASLIAAVASAEAGNDPNAPPPAPVAPAPPTPGEPAPPAPTEGPSET